jgi:hypothetical protein
MFWEPQRVALPEHCVLKSAAALSRFMNEYGWPTRAVIRATRKQVLKELLKYAPRGKRAHLQVIIDLTTVNLLLIEVESKRDLHLHPRFKSGCRLGK